MNIMELERYLFEHGWRKVAGGNWKQSGIGMVP